MTDDTQLLRAVSNTLWPYLRARDEDGEDTGWTAYRETRALSPTGNPRSHSYSGAGHIAGPQPTVEVISVTFMIITYLWSGDWPGRAAYRIELEREAARRRVSGLNAATIADYETALEHASCRKPFTVEVENGVRRLTRNRHDGTITHLTAAALEAIAATAVLEPIQPEIESQLLTDTDISPLLVDLAVGRGST